MNEWLTNWLALKKHKKLVFVENIFKQYVYPVSGAYIDKVLANLKSTKIHSQDMINICMLKIWSDTICRPLKIIFKQLY